VERCVGRCRSASKSGGGGKGKKTTCKSVNYLPIRLKNEKGGGGLDFYKNGRIDGEKVS